MVLCVKILTPTKLLRSHLKTMHDVKKNLDDTMKHCLSPLTEMFMKYSFIAKDVKVSKIIVCSSVLKVHYIKLKTRI